MDRLFTGTSKILDTCVRLVEHTALTQNEVGKEGVVLWTNRPLVLDSITYIEFKEALKKRQSKYYMHNHILSYPDFCISILCCLDYSLNHKVTAAIPSRTFTAAWRSMETIKGTGTDNVTSWIKEHMSGRTAVGYCNTLGVVLDNSTISMSVGDNIGTRNNIRDTETISSITTMDKIIKIPRYNENDDNNENNSTGKVFSNSFTSEGPLYDLLNAYSLYNHKFF